MAKKPPTREQEYGVSGKRLANLSRRKLKAIRKLLADIDAPWADVCNTVCTDADMLRSACNDFEEGLEGAIEWLKQEPGT